jgi:hypothetical protein
MASIAGVIAIADAPKPGSAGAVASLRRLGLEVVMLTGDNVRTAEAIARTLGIERVLADVRPDGKAAAIGALRAETRGTVAMVGDGINDAPALASADVGNRDGHGHGRRDGIGGRHADVRRPARPRDRDRAVPRDDGQHPPEPLLGVRLQRGPHSGRDGRALPVHRAAPGPDPRGRGKWPSRRSPVVSNAPPLRGFRAA